MRKQKGFSLIELLIVVAIILIIAAIAIPNLMRSRMAANEASAAQTLRIVSVAEISYITTFPGSYATLVQLSPPAGGCPATGGTAANACLIDSILATGTKSGYTLTIPVVTATSFNANNDPITRGTTGQRSFFVDESGVIRADPAAAATAASAAIQ